MTLLRLRSEISPLPNPIAGPSGSEGNELALKRVCGTKLRIAEIRTKPRFRLESHGLIFALPEEPGGTLFSNS